jgi:hypothetical protein
MSNILTVIAKGSYSDDWPEIQVFENNQLCGTSKIQEYSEIDFSINLNNVQNIIRIDYINKTESSTKVEQGVIVQDQYVEIKGLRLDNILLDKWIITESDYYPKYFPGFLKYNPIVESKIRSQLIWHFPGSFVIQPLPNKEIFWDWYFYQIRNVYVKYYSGKDQSRNEQYAGSLDPLDQLINEINSFINV